MKRLFSLIMILGVLLASYGSSSDRRHTRGMHNGTAPIARSGTDHSGVPGMSGTATSSTDHSGTPGMGSDGTATKGSLFASIPYWDQKAAYASFRQNIGLFNTVSLFWYYLDPKGEIRKYKAAVDDQSIINTAQEHGVKALVLVANLPDDRGDWDPRRVDEVISSPDRRRRHISDLLRLIEDKGFDGINIDYEGLERPQREDFSLFIEELAEELHKRDKILGVAIHPKTSEDNPQESYGAHAQDLERIGGAADQLYFMTYLEHGTWSGPGPIGSIDWTTKVMRYAIGEAGVPPEKAFLGVGLVGVGWLRHPDGKWDADDGDFTFAAVRAIARRNDVQVQWDEKAKSPFLEYEVGGIRRVVWFENARSVKARVDLARSLRLGGVHFWYPGGEDPCIWEEIEGSG